jgi:hypothetical protein
MIQDERKRCWTESMFSYTEQDVLHVELENVPRCLGEFAGKLAEQNINITTAYGSAAKRCDRYFQSV